MILCFNFILNVVYKFIYLFICRKYYRKHRFIGVYEYRTPKLLILDPALVTEIYVKYFKHFGDNTMSDFVIFSLIHN